MIALDDISGLMQKTVSRGITFMFSPGGLPKHYNIVAAYHNGVNNRSVHLSFDEARNQIVQSANENHAAVVFDSVNAVAEYICNELGAV